MRGTVLAGDVFTPRDSHTGEAACRRADRLPFPAICDVPVAPRPGCRGGEGPPRLCYNWPAGLASARGPGERSLGRSHGVVRGLPGECGHRFSLVGALRVHIASAQTLLGTYSSRSFVLVGVLISPGSRRILKVSRYPNSLSVQRIFM